MCTYIYIYIYIHINIFTWIYIDVAKRMTSVQLPVHLEKGREPACVTSVPVFMSLSLCGNSGGWLKKNCMDLTKPHLRQIWVFKFLVSIWKSWGRLLSKCCHYELVNMALQIGLLSRTPSHLHESIGGKNLRLDEDSKLGRNEVVDAGRRIDFWPGNRRIFPNDIWKFQSLGIWVVILE